MKRLMFLVISLLVLSVAGVASAHVTMWPKSSAANGYERYTIRVPNEKDNPTVKLRVEIPAGTTFSAVLPVPGWTFTTEKDASGKVSALVWSGGQIKPGEFFEFGVSVRNPKEAGTVPWKAYQSYQDGSVVDWTGPAGSDKPAPTVTLATAATGDSQGHDTGATTAPSTAPAGADHGTAAPAVTASGTNSVGTWLGGAGLALSLVALILAVRKR